MIHPRNVFEHATKTTNCQLAGAEMREEEYKELILVASLERRLRSRSTIATMKIAANDIVLIGNNGQYCKYCHYQRDHYSFLNNLRANEEHLRTCPDVGDNRGCRCEPCHVCLDEVCPSCQTSVLFEHTPLGRSSESVHPRLVYRDGGGGELEVSHLCHPVGSIETDEELRSRLVEGRSVNASFLQTAQVWQKSEMAFWARRRQEEAWQEIQAVRKRHADALLRLHARLEHNRRVRHKAVARYHHLRARYHFHKEHRALGRTLAWIKLAWYEDEDEDEDPALPPRKKKRAAGGGVSATSESSTRVTNALQYSSGS
jgi:hypothetical protein